VKQELVWFQVVQEKQEQEYAVEGVVPTVVPFRVVEKQVLGDVHAVPYTITATCWTTCPFAHGSLNVQQLTAEGQS